MNALIVEQRPQGASPALMAHLRSTTADEHRKLEHALDLLRPPFEQGRFIHLLERFYGFHLPWETAIRRYSDIADFTKTRSRLPALRRDLGALGVDEARLDALAHCEASAALARSRAHALGSLYVIEGSSLGGQVIAREMAQAEWLPQGGLAYFNPYAERTGAMWRGFKDWCEDSARREDHECVADGARETFAMLRVWLTT